MKNNESNLYNLNVIKTFLMITVVLYHSSIFWNGSWFDTIEPVYKSRTIGLIAMFINTFHVQAFTLVSGYIYQFLKHEKGKYKGFKKFFINKVKRLIIPYLSVAIFWVIPITAYLYKYDLKTIIIKYVLCTSPSQLWFLWMLFNVFIIVFLFDKFLESNTYALFLAIICYGVGVAGSKVFPNVFCIRTAFKYITYFVIGMLLRKNTKLFLHNVPVIVYISLHILMFMICTYGLDGNGIIFKITRAGA